MGMEIKNMMCRKCMKEMKYKGTRFSGDVEYAVYKCKDCGSESLKCMGVDLDK